MHSFDTGNFKLDIEGTGENMVDVPKGTFNVQRGDLDKHFGLRLQIQIPNGVVGTGPDNKGQQLTVSDIVDTSNNQNILYAAQFADYIQMTVKGVAIGGGEPADPLPCPVQSRRLAARSLDAAEGIVPEGAVAACDASKNKPRMGTRW